MPCVNSCPIVYTASQKSLTTFFVCHKTTLNTGVVGGQGRTSNLKNEELRTSFLSLWHLAYQFRKISNKMKPLEELLNMNFHFYCSKKGQFLFESFSRSSKDKFEGPPLPCHTAPMALRFTPYHAIFFQILKCHILT